MNSKSRLEKQNFAMALIAMLCGLQFSPAALGANPQYSSRALQGPPNLPFLVQVGGTFVRAHEFPNLNNSQCVSVVYTFSGTPEQVLSSIAQSLPSQGWTVDPRQAKAQQLTAEKRKDHVSLSVRTQPGDSAGQTTGTLRYLVQTHK